MNSLFYFLKPRRIDRTGFSLSSFFSPKPHGNVCYAGYMPSSSWVWLQVLSWETWREFKREEVIDILVLQRHSASTGYSPGPVADLRALNKKFIQRSLRRLKCADPSSCYLQNYWKLYHNVHNSNSSPALIYNIPGFSRKAPFTLLLGGAKKANVKRRKSPSTSLLLPH